MNEQNGTQLSRYSSEQLTQHVQRLESDLAAYRSALQLKDLLIQQLQRQVQTLAEKHDDSLEDPKTWAMETNTEGR